MTHPLDRTLSDHLRQLGHALARNIDEYVGASLDSVPRPALYIALHTECATLPEGLAHWRMCGAVLYEYGLTFETVLEINPDLLDLSSVPTVEEIDVDLHSVREGFVILWLVIEGANTDNAHFIANVTESLLKRARERP